MRVRLDLQDRRPALADFADDREHSPRGHRLEAERGLVEK
jgi:hypothetical protein